LCYSAEGPDGWGVGLLRTDDQVGALDTVDDDPGSGRHGFVSRGLRTPLLALDAHHPARLVSHELLDDDAALAHQPVGAGADRWFVGQPVRVATQKDQHRRRHGDERHPLPAHAHSEELEHSGSKGTDAEGEQEEACGEYLRDHQERSEQHPDPEPDVGIFHQRLPARELESTPTSTIYRLEGYC
jgi:hypothetical protein